VHLQHRRLIASDYFTCLAFLSGICGAALDIKLMKLGWLNPSTTWSEFEANANSKPSTQKVITKFRYLDHSAEVLVVCVHWMVSTPHHTIPQQSRNPLISFLCIPTNFAIDSLFFMGSYDLLCVIIRLIDRACVPKLSPSDRGKGVRARARAF
jgi:hypothetical protein